MLCPLRKSIFVLLFLSAATVLCGAQDFSADAVNLKSGEQGRVAKLFVSGSKVRLEMTDRDQDMMTGGAVLYDLDQHTYTILIPQRQMYMEMRRLPQHAFAFWRPTDPNDACPEWKNLSNQLAPHPENKIATCHKVGNDTVNGRSAIKYEGTNSEGKKGAGWVDAKLRWLIKYVDEDGSGMEFRNIQEGSQPASLFEIPPGYQKMDMGGMMGRGMNPPNQ